MFELDLHIVYIQLLTKCGERQQQRAYITTTSVQREVRGVYNMFKKNWVGGVRGEGGIMWVRGVINGEVRGDIMWGGLGGSEGGGGVRMMFLKKIGGEVMLGKPPCDKPTTVQPKRNKRISRSAAARRNESMPRQSLKPRQYAAASRILPRNFASVRRGMPQSAT
ncbi:hypothetical protein DPMN_002080 [Dreissena polymorpha]|uniref:Uncharacterized protein n=1 Tax=Dreissena polymorpha TaxID=45954 RepID=A0A9D4MLJ7_DREPO|nr:hypothetical protein DPMN_002080 [Dreissena polymorpha]